VFYLQDVFDEDPMEHQQIYISNQARLIAVLKLSLSAAIWATLFSIGVAGCCVEAFQLVLSVYYVSQ
jgi:hypothetical protein